MLDPAAHDALIQLGLTDLEASIYALLLQDSPATGYGIAKALGKPTANVYKALDTLAVKGAIEFDEGQARQCRPVPVQELMAGLEQRFRRHRDRAVAGLGKLPGPGQDTRIYHLRDAEQVYARCRQLLDGAQQIALLDLFVSPVATLRESIERTAARGVMVVMKVYEDVSLPGAEVFLEPERERIRGRWPAQWINMVVDGSEMLLALLTADGRRVVQAVWSSSPFLSWVHYTGVAAEIVETGLRGGRVTNLDARQHDELNHWHKKLIVSEATGFRRLRAQLGLGGEEPAGPKED